MTLFKRGLSLESSGARVRVMWTLVRLVHKRTGDSGEPSVDCSEVLSTKNQQLARFIPWTLVSYF
jgi:hypothetical protein